MGRITVATNLLVCLVLAGCKLDLTREEALRKIQAVHQPIYFRVSGLALRTEKVALFSAVRPV